MNRLPGDPGGGPEPLKQAIPVKDKLHLWNVQFRFRRPDRPGGGGQVPASDLPGALMGILAECHKYNLPLEELHIVRVDPSSIIPANSIPGHG